MGLQVAARSAALSATLRPTLSFPLPTNGAESSEFVLDGEQPEWWIPVERMNMREAHIVPLSMQAVKIRTGHTSRSYRAAYNRTQRLAERRATMQSWADYIEGLNAGLTPAFGQDGKEPRV